MKLFPLLFVNLAIATEYKVVLDILVIPTTLEETVGRNIQQIMNYEVSNNSQCVSRKLLLTSNKNIEKEIFNIPYHNLFGSLNNAVCDIIKIEIYSTTNENHLYYYSTIALVTSFSFIAFISIAYKKLMKKKNYNTITTI